VIQTFFLAKRLVALSSWWNLVRFFCKVMSHLPNSPQQVWKKNPQLCALKNVLIQTDILTLNTSFHSERLMLLT
jgi:hypothetical protein